MELRKSVIPKESSEEIKPIEIELNKILENAQLDVTTEKSKKDENQTIIKSIHKDHRSRLRYQFLKSGIDSLSDIQKLELLLFYSIPLKDTNPLAHALIDKFGSLKNVFHADYSDLIKVNGIKDNTAVLIKLISGMINVFNRPSLNERFSSVSAAKNFCTRLYTGIDVEQFYVICLTKSNKIKNIKLMNSGTMDEVNVQIRNITAFALESKCNRIVISHNHPGGNGAMSDEDASFTYSLLCSCLLNSIDILDHIIVGSDKTISMCQQNYIQKLRERAVKTIQLPKDKLLFLSNSSANYLID